MTASAPSFAQSVWLVTEREIGSKLRSKAFLISTAILFVIALASVLWGGFAAGGDNRIPVAVTSQTASALQPFGEAVEVTEAADATEARDLAASLIQLADKLPA